MDTKHFSIACQAAQLFDLRAERFTIDGDERILLTYGGEKLARLPVNYERAAYWAGYFYPKADLVSNDDHRIILSIPKA